MRTTEDKRVDADAVGDALADDIMRDVASMDREVLGGRVVRKASTWQDVALRERLADLCHEQWSGWMRYLFGKGSWNDISEFLIDAESAKRWYRQMRTPYAGLSKGEQDSDRKEADKFIECILVQGTSQ